MKAVTKISILINNNFYLQARFTAYDSKNPGQIARGELSILVLRNQNSPDFNPAFYRKTIADTFAVGTVVLTVTASDADGVSCLLIQNILQPL